MVLRKRRRLARSVGAALMGVFLLLLPLPGWASGLKGQTPAHGTGAQQKQPEFSLSVLEGELRNRTLYEALRACDIPSAEVLSLSQAFAPIFDFRRSRPKDHYRVSVDDDNLIHRFVYKTSPLHEYEAFKDDSGGFSVNKREITLDRQEVAQVFTVTASLYQAVLDGGEDQQLAGLIADIFAWDIDFYLYPRRGDRIAVVYERAYKDGTFVQYGDILAAQYVGRQRTFSAFLFNDGRFDDYYDEKGQPLKKMFLQTPVKIGRMTSSFSFRRFHPVSKRYQAHTGIDYGAPTGTPIHATANGRVTFAGWKSGYGKLMIVGHPNGYSTYYGHCSKLLRKSGQLVEQGQVIAQVGQTGVATGPHVHYEVRVNGAPIDPKTVKTNQAKPLKPELLVKFKETVSQRLLIVDNLLQERTSLVMLTSDH